MGRELSERHRQDLELVRQENEAQRNVAEQLRQTAEAGREAIMESVAATAEALSVNLAQMQFLLNAHKVFREIAGNPRTKIGNASGSGLRSGKRVPKLVPIRSCTLHSE